MWDATQENRSSRALREENQCRKIEGGGLRGRGDQAGPRGFTRPRPALERAANDELEQSAKTTGPFHGFN